MYISEIRKKNADKVTQPFFPIKLKVFFTLRSSKRLGGEVSRPLTYRTSVFSMLTKSLNFSFNHFLFHQKCH